MLKTLLFSLAFATTALFAQQPATPAPSPSNAGTATSEAGTHGTALKNHILVLDNVSQVDKSSVVNYGFGISSGSAATETVHGAPIIMAEFQKKCPALTLTVNPHLAEYLLIPQAGASQLLRAGDVNRKGDVVYISPARKITNPVKDICKYAASH